MKSDSREGFAVCCVSTSFSRVCIAVQSYGNNKSSYSRKKETYGIHGNSATCTDEYYGSISNATVNGIEEKKRKFRRLRILSSRILTIPLLTPVNNNSFPPCQITGNDSLYDDRVKPDHCHNRNLYQSEYKHSQISKYKGGLVLDTSGSRLYLFNVRSHRPSPCDNGISRSSHLENYRNFNSFGVLASVGFFTELILPVSIMAEWKSLIQICTQQQMEVKREQKDVGFPALLVASSAAEESGAHSVCNILQKKNTFRDGSSGSAGKGYIAVVLSEQIHPSFSTRSESPRPAAVKSYSLWLYNVLTRRWRSCDLTMKEGTEMLCTPSSSPPDSKLFSRSRFYSHDANNFECHEKNIGHDLDGMRMNISTTSQMKNPQMKNVTINVDANENENHVINSAKIDLSCANSTVIDANYSVSDINRDDNLSVDINPDGGNGNKPGVCRADILPLGYIGEQIPFHSSHDERNSRAVDQNSGINDSPDVNDSRENNDIGRSQSCSTTNTVSTSSVRAVQWFGDHTIILLGIAASATDGADVGYKRAASSGGSNGHNNNHNRSVNMISLRATSSLHSSSLSTTQQSPRIIPPRPPLPHAYSFTCPTSSISTFLSPPTSVSTWFYLEMVSRAPNKTSLRAGKLHPAVHRILTLPFPFSFSCPSTSPYLGNSSRSSPNSISSDNITTDHSGNLADTSSHINRNNRSQDHKQSNDYISFSPQPFDHFPNFSPSNYFFEIQHLGNSDDNGSNDCDNCVINGSGDVKKSVGQCRREKCLVVLSDGFWCVGYLLTASLIMTGVSEEDITDYEISLLWNVNLSVYTAHLNLYHAKDKTDDSAGSSHGNGHDHVYNNYDSDDRLNNNCVASLFLPIMSLSILPQSHTCLQTDTKSKPDSDSADKRSNGNNDKYNDRNGIECSSPTAFEVTLLLLDCNGSAWHYRPMRKTVNGAKDKGRDFVHERQSGRKENCVGHDEQNNDKKEKNSENKDFNESSGNLGSQTLSHGSISMIGKGPFRIASVFDSSALFNSDNDDINCKNAYPFGLFNNVHESVSTAILHRDKKWKSKTESPSIHATVICKGEVNDLSPLHGDYMWVKRDVSEDGMPYVLSSQSLLIPLFPQYDLINSDNYDDNCGEGKSDRYDCDDSNDDMKNRRSGRVNNKSLISPSCHPLYDIIDVS